MAIMVRSYQVAVSVSNDNLPICGPFIYPGRQLARLFLASYWPGLSGLPPFLLVRSVRSDFCFRKTN